MGSALDVRGLASKLQGLLKLESQPVAVKLARSQDELEGFRTPGSMGLKLAVCQALAMSWRYEWRVAVKAEECACAVAKVIFGWRRVDVESFAKAFLKAGFYRDMCAAVRASREALETCVLREGECIAVASTPLAHAPWTPDVILIYCTPAQAQLLSLGYSYSNGDSVEVRYTGKHSSCGYGIARTYISKRATLTPPGGGDKVFAACDSTHLIFSMPSEAIGDVVRGVEAVVRSGVMRHPAPVYLRFEPKLPGPFTELEGGANTPHT